MNPLARFLMWLDEWYNARHPHGDGPLVRRFNDWINRRYPPGPVEKDQK